MTESTPAATETEVGQDVVLPLRLMITDRTPAGIARLKQRASEMDSGDDPPTKFPDDYSVAQAITVLLHNAPAELFESWVQGWTVETPWDELAEPACPEEGAVRETNRPADEGHAPTNLNGVDQ